MPRCKNSRRLAIPTFMLYPEISTLNRGAEYPTCMIAQVQALRIPKRDKLHIP